MYTIWELITNAAQSSIPGFIGVSGIFLLFVLLVGFSAYRVKEFLDQEDQH
ncbi:MAG: hypothetical protein ACLFRL_05285 [Desulfohalobiaceae bacterium]